MLWAILAGAILFVGNMICERSGGPEAVVIVKKKPQGVANKKTGKVHRRDYRQNGDSLHP